MTPPGKTVVEMGDKLWLRSFETFCRIYVPVENRTRKERNQEPLSNDEAINLFLDMRKKYGISE